MLLKAVELLLNIARKVYESCREMPKGYWPASEKFLKGIGKPLGNAQIPTTSQKRRRGRIS
jgi:hypothetical protein